VVAANGRRIVERRTIEIRKATVPILAGNQIIHHIIIVENKVTVLKDLG
jgi:hypothetical protein